MGYPPLVALAQYHKNALKHRTYCDLVLERIFRL
jgi:hypothetical protein